MTYQYFGAACLLQAELTKLEERHRSLSSVPSLEAGQKAMIWREAARLVSAFKRRVAAEGYHYFPWPAITAFTVIGWAVVTRREGTDLMGDPNVQLIQPLKWPEYDRDYYPADVAIDIAMALNRSRQQNQQGEST